MLPIYSGFFVYFVFLTFEILRLIFFTTVLFTKADKAVVGLNIFWRIYR